MAGGWKWQVGGADHLTGELVRFGSLRVASVELMFKQKQAKGTKNSKLEIIYIGFRCQWSVVRCKSRLPALVLATELGKCEEG